MSFFRARLERHLNDGSGIGKATTLRSENIAMRMRPVVSIAYIADTIREYFSDFECRTLDRTDDDAQLMFLADPLIAVTITIVGASLMVTIKVGE